MLVNWRTLYYPFEMFKMFSNVKLWTALLLILSITIGLVSSELFDRNAHVSGIKIDNGSYMVTDEGIQKQVDELEYLRLAKYFELKMLSLFFLFFAFGNVVLSKRPPHKSVRDL
jgi:hypothetical protein